MDWMDGEEYYNYGLCHGEFKRRPLLQPFLFDRIRHIESPFREVEIGH
jgi:hypothetical protein